MGIDIKSEERSGKGDGIMSDRNALRTQEDLNCFEVLCTIHALRGKLDAIEGYACLYHDGIKQKLRYDAMGVQACADRLSKYIEALVGPEEQE